MFATECARNIAVQYVLHGFSRAVFCYISDRIQSELEDS